MPETAPLTLRSSECRVSERFPSEKSTQLQPVAARADSDPVWPARVRDISKKGIGLLLPRRFERGTGLAIELPDGNDGNMRTVFAKVINVRPHSGQWILGCAFVSELTDESLGLVLTPPLPETPAETMVPEVRLWTRFGGVTLSRMVRHLYVKGAWPMPAGTIVQARVGSGTNLGTPVAMRVNVCEWEADGWSLHCSLIGHPPEELLRMLRRSPVPSH